MSIDCVVYRCARQPEMYLYLRTDVAPEKLPEELLRLTGRLTRVMELTLDPARKLARVDVTTVMARLESAGHFLQLPPANQINPHLNDSD